jgi:hypothetical protein
MFCYFKGKNRVLTQISFSYNGFMIITLKEFIESNEPISGICHPGDRRSGVFRYRYPRVLRPDQSGVCRGSRRHTGRAGVFCGILAEKKKELNAHRKGAESIFHFVFR